MASLRKEHRSARGTKHFAQVDKEIALRASELVVSIHPIAEKAHSRKLTVASSRRRTPGRGCMRADVGPIRPHTGVYGSACCEDEWQSITGCCS